jgi:hypothetical protein
MRTFVCTDTEGLTDALRVATPADTIHTAFPPSGHYPRLFVSGEKWAVVSWSATDTNGRWRRGADGLVQHTPSPPGQHS